MNELLTTQEMAQADALAVAAGVPSIVLMENAGKAVAHEACRMRPHPGRIVVLCGPGNNGGDGYAAARLLKASGHEIRVYRLGDAGKLKGDAAEMARRLDGHVRPANSDALQSMDLIIDALFGAGLSRPLEGDAGEMIGAINSSGIPVLSIDVPSGVDGSTGAAAGPAIKADCTITFFRKKPGHLLLPGRALCGDVVVADIGIPDVVLQYPPPPPAEGAPSARRAEGAPSTRRGEGLGVGGSSRAESLGQNSSVATSASQSKQSARDVTPPPTPPRRGEGSRMGPLGSHALQISAFENTPDLWLSQFSRPSLDGHKYTRGHAVVVSGPAHQTGAARLSARGALRMGAGLVTVASSPQALLINAAHLTAIMLAPFADARGLATLLEDERRNAVLIGPGAGVGPETCELVETVLASGAAVVLDADALTSFATPDQGSRAETVRFGFTSATTTAPATPIALFALIGAKPERPVVMTPHEGEFKKLFGEIAGCKLDRARVAAKLSGATVVLKGPDTLIASPDGRAAINANAPPWLATAGSGDVLAGFITGLLAQKMPEFEAACAAVWLHGACAAHFGPGLIAEDLPEALPHVLHALHQSS